jgi:hypothetical protein
VAHVAFKIPDFWPHDPNTWFRRQESRRGNMVAAVNANYEATVNGVSGGRRRENSPHDRRRRSPSRPPFPGPYKEDGDIFYYHHTYGDR